MTDVRPQRRIAAEMLKCGVHRVWVDEQYLSEVSLALTRDDIRKLIDDKVIRKKQIQGVSRGRAREHTLARTEGKRRGYGRRSGKKGARTGPKKRLWINRIRPQRRYLRGLRDNDMITPTQYRELYRKAKGGQYRSLSYLRGNLVESGIIKESTTRTRVRGR